MAEAPVYYRLDLPLLGDRFKDGVPFSEWADLCETAGKRGFPSGSLRKKTGHDLTALQLIERIAGCLLYINISGAGAVWLCLAGLSRFLGWNRLVSVLLAYVSCPALVWFLLKRIYQRDHKKPRYEYFYQHQHSYLHMKYVWPAEFHPVQRAAQGPFIFCVVPHGVLPFGIDYAMIDQLGGAPCMWCAAPVLFKLPFLRKYLKEAGVMPAKAANIKETLQNSQNVGVVLDGVAGIFQPRSGSKENACLLRRKGIVKIALQSGATIVPIYGFGHTSLLSTLLDPFKILEKISIKLDTSFVPFYGRWGLPMGPPRRIPVAMAAGTGIRCPLVESPDQADIDKYHLEMLDSFRTVFDTHKDAYGWAHKELTCV